MTTFALNYAIRETKGALKGNLGWLFTIFHLHSDQLLRCYPSNETLKEETGIRHDKTLQKHRDELIAMKALVIVPYEKRLSGKEKGQSPRKIIYQITGVMELPDGKIIPTVHINSPDVLATHVSLLESLGFDTKLIWRAYGEISKPVKSEGLKPAKSEGLKPAKSEDEVVQESSTEEVKEKTPLPPVDDTSSELLAMQEAVKKHLKQYGRANEQVSKSLLGLHVGKNESLNLSRKFTPALLEKFTLWWDKNYRKDGKPLTRPKNLDSVKSYGETFLESLKPAQPLTKLYAEPAILPSVTDGMVTFNKPPKKERAS